MSMQDKKKSTYLMRAERQSAETLGGKIKNPLGVVGSHKNKKREKEKS